MQVKFLK